MWSLSVLHVHPVATVEHVRSVVVHARSIAMSVPAVTLRQTVPVSTAGINKVLNKQNRLPDRLSGSLFLCLMVGVIQLQIVAYLVSLI